MAERVHQEAEQGLDLRLYLWILYRRWLWVVGTVLITLLLAAAYLRTSPYIYEAKSVVRIRKQVPTMFLFQPIPQMMMREGELVELKTAQRLVLTRMNAEEALRLLKKAIPDAKGASSPTNKLVLDEVTPEALLRIVTAKGLEPDLIEITARHELPELAVAIANSFARAFVDRIARESRLEATKEREFIQTQLSQAADQLKALEQQVATVKRELGTVDLDKETEMLVTMLRTAETELRTADAQAQAAEREAEQLRQAAARETPFLSVELPKESPTFIALKQQLAQLELKRAEFSARYLPNHPSVQQVEEQLKAVRDSLSNQLNRFVKEPETAPNPLYATMREKLMDVEARRLTSEAKRQAMIMLRSDLEKKMEALPDQQRRLGELLRQRQIMEQTYTALLMRYQDAQIREAGKVGGAVIADLAGVPPMPVQPRPTLTLALALILGLMVGIGGAFLLEAMDNSVETPEEVKQATGLPTLSIVSKTRPELTQDHILDLMSSRRSAAEAIRTLRSNLKFLSVDKPLHCLLITSALPGEGKTFTAAALAISFAQAGQRVIFVDADLRHPSIHRRFGIDNDVGLTSVLVGGARLDEVLYPSPLQNIWFLPTGPLPPNPAELLDTEAMRQLLKQLKERADLVILDTPPVLVVTDPTVLASQVDGILIVTEAGHTPREALAKTKEQLDLAQGHVLGVILNKVTGKTGRGYYYYRYYGYGYHYYRYYGEEM